MSVVLVADVGDRVRAASQRLFYRHVTPSRLLQGTGKASRGKPPVCPLLVVTSNADVIQAAQCEPGAHVPRRRVQQRARQLLQPPTGSSTVRGTGNSRSSGDSLGTSTTSGFSASQRASTR